MTKLKNGTLINSYFNTRNEASAQDVYDEGLRFMYGQVEKIIYTDDPTNISKKFIEYDVSVRDAKGGQSIFKNVRKMSSIFGVNDFEETVLESNEFAFSGKLDTSNFFANKNGTTVVLAFLHGSKDKPFIIGTFDHPKKKGGTKKDGIHKKGEFRGFQWEINKDGDFILTYNGAKKANGQPANPALSKTTFKIGKDGKVQTTTGHRITIENDKGKEKIQVYTAGKQLFEINDLTGEESITMVHKKGALFNIDKNGSIKLTSADGSYLFLDAESGAVSLVQADGNVFTIGEENTLGSSDGKKAFSVLPSKLQAFSDTDINLQASGKMILDAGGIILQDTIAKITIQNGQVALGTPAAELLDLFDQTLVQLNTLTTAMAAETHIGNLGYPTSPPLNAAAYAAVGSALTVIKSLLLTIKGSI